MIDFTVDTSSLSEEFNLDRDDVDSLLEHAVKSVTEAFARHWDTAAKNTLGSTRDQYRNAIQVASQGRFTGIAYLNPASWIANAVEMGHGSFDMKAGLLNGPNVKQGKNGPYTTVPFQFATPDSVGESSLFAGVMPKAVHKAVVKTEKEFGVGSALPLSNIPAQYQIPKSAAMRRKIKEIGFDKMEENSGKTSIYEGMRRSKKGSGYTAFRRVSLRSDAESWIHPGFQARDLASQAINMLNIPHEVDMAIDGYLAQLGFS